MCGQHGTEVGSHEKPEDQGSHDSTELIQVMSSQTVKTLLPGSDLEILLMTEVPEQTWLPLLPSLPPQSNEDQSLPVQSAGPSRQDSDYHFNHGEVSRDEGNRTYVVPPTTSKVVSCEDIAECLGGQSMADNLGKTSDAGIPVQEDIEMSKPRLVHDKLSTDGLAYDDDSHEYGSKVQVTYLTQDDVTPVHAEEVSLFDDSQQGQSYMSAFCLTSSDADRFHHTNEDESQDYGTTLMLSTVSSYIDMYKAMSEARDIYDVPVYTTMLTGKICGPGQTSQPSKPQTRTEIGVSCCKDASLGNGLVPLSTCSSARISHDSQTHHSRWLWRDGVLWEENTCTNGPNAVCQWWIEVEMTQDKWLDYEGVPRMYIHNPHGVCQEILLSETKFEPPDQSPLNMGHSQEEEKMCRLNWRTPINNPQVFNSQSHRNTTQESLVTETKYKPPGMVLEETKWHWCDGVPWMCSADPQGYQDGSPRHKYLEVETKYRPPDNILHM